MLCLVVIAPELTRWTAHHKRARLDEHEAPWGLLRSGRYQGGVTSEALWCPEHHRRSYSDFSMYLLELTIALTNAKVNGPDQSWVLRALNP